MSCGGWEAGMKDSIGREPRRRADDGRGIRSPIESINSGNRFNYRFQIRVDDSALTKVDSDHDVQCNNATDNQPVKFSPQLFQLHRLTRGRPQRLFTMMTFLLTAQIPTTDEMNHR